MRTWKEFLEAKATFDPRTATLDPVLGSKPVQKPLTPEEEKEAGEQYSRSMIAQQKRAQDILAKRRVPQV